MVASTLTCVENVKQIAAGKNHPPTCSLRRREEFVVGGGGRSLWVVGGRTLPFLGFRREQLTIDGGEKKNHEAV